MQQVPCEPGACLVHQPPQQPARMCILDEWLNIILHFLWQWASESPDRPSQKEVSSGALIKAAALPRGQPF